MPIQFQCICGKTISAPSASSGEKIRCPFCRFPHIVPEVSADSTGEHLQSLLGPQALQNAAKSLGLRRYLYFLFLLAFIPLVFTTFQTRPNFEELQARTIAAHPEIPDRSRKITGWEEQFANGQATFEDFFNLLPGHRLIGALLPYESELHWLMAVASAACFFVWIILVFPRASRFLKGMILATLFTATVGLLLLIALQYVAFYSSGIHAFGGGKAFLILLFLKMIAYSYTFADDPKSNFLISFVGYTCGVGLCKEITKLLPLLRRIKPIAFEEEPSWNTLLIWGLASGTGFGVAEGIMYSSRY